MAAAEAEARAQLARAQLGAPPRDAIFSWLRAVAAERLLRASRLAKRGGAPHLARSTQLMLRTFRLCEKNGALTPFVPALFQRGKELVVLFDITRPGDAVCYDILATVTASAEGLPEVNLYEAGGGLEGAEVGARPDGLPVVSEGLAPPEGAPALVLGAAVGLLHLLGNPGKACSSAAQNMLTSLKKAGVCGDSVLKLGELPAAPRPEEEKEREEEEEEEEEEERAFALFRCQVDNLPPLSERPADDDPHEPPARLRGGTSDLLQAAAHDKHIAALAERRGIRMSRVQRRACLRPDLASGWLRRSPPVGWSGCAVAATLRPGGDAAAVVLFPGGRAVLPPGWASARLRLCFPHGQHQALFRAGAAMVSLRREAGHDAPSVLLAEGTTSTFGCRSLRCWQDDGLVRVILRNNGAQPLELSLPESLGRGNLLEIHGVAARPCGRERQTLWLRSAHLPPSVARPPRPTPGIRGTSAHTTTTWA